jgi:UDP-N-acetylglucosamine 2-epimerase (non-hydrolysing)
MQRFESVVQCERPDVVVVVGDVNSTLAAALVAAKLGVRVAHVEAGLRSFDRTMPEEINRVLTDALADQLFTTEQSANENLAREGIPAERIFFVGNILVDSLEWATPRIQASRILQRLGFGDESAFALATLHRPANVDGRDRLAANLRTLAELSCDVPVIFPVHPRTRAQIDGLELGGHCAPPHREDGSRAPLCGITLLEPLSYPDFLRLLSCARVVLTDSGGVQEECACFGVPCLTLRDTTERPVTVTVGTNAVVGTDRRLVLARARAAIGRCRGPVQRPPLWDGQTAPRIARIVVGGADGARASVGSVPPSAAPGGCL